MKTEGKKNHAQNVEIKSLSTHCKNDNEFD